MPILELAAEYMHVCTHASMHVCMYLYAIYQLAGNQGKKRAIFLYILVYAYTVKRTLTAAQDRHIPLVPVCSLSEEADATQQTHVRFRSYPSCTINSSVKQSPGTHQLRHASS
jgi:hypothetical protein